MGTPNETALFIAAIVLAMAVVLTSVARPRAGSIFPVASASDRSQSGCRGK
jgi:hypothetical protein